MKKEADVATKQEIEALIAHSQDETAPTKSLQQLLAENPQHKGGLAQLASAEREAQFRSAVAQANPSRGAFSKPASDP